MFQRRKVRALFLLALFGVFLLTACTIGGDKPTVVIVDPPSGSQFREGDEIQVRSASADAKGIVRVELVVDNVIVRADASPTPQGQTAFNLIQTWQATTGQHTIMVRAFNASGTVSDPVAVSVNVAPQIAQVSPTPLPSSSSSASSVLSSVASSSSASSSLSSASTSTASSSASGCTTAAAFVADVTIQDGTLLNPNQAFTKIWRVTNTGTCTWGVGYQFVFIAGEAMSGSTVTPVPMTAPGATIDLPVPMTAPVAPGAHAGQWRLRALNGALFGPTLTVKITTVGASSSASSSSTSASSSSTATGCSGTPNIASFAASPTAIVAGGSSTLSWGAVTNADSVEIDHGIGGVPAPGSTAVTPSATTTYLMTARCGANTKTASVTVTVNPALPPAIGLIVRNALGGSESGTVYEPSAGQAPVLGTMLAGDIAANKFARAFMSFDISDMGGKTIVNAQLDLTGCGVAGDPFAAPMSGFWVGELQYGLPLDQADYDLAGTGIVHLTAKPTTTIDVKSYVISRINQGKTRFQIRLHSYGPVNNNGASDYFSCGGGVPKLSITFQ